MEALKDFSEKEQAAFSFILKNEQAVSKIVTDVEDIKLYLGYSCTSEFVLTLKNANGAPTDESNCYDFSKGYLTKQGDKYVLSGESVGCEDINNLFDLIKAAKADDIREPFSVTFTDAEFSYFLYKEPDVCYAQVPYVFNVYIESVAQAITEKANISESFLNDREKALLPLMRDFEKLWKLEFIADKYEPVEFPALRPLIREYGYTKLLRLLDKLSENIKAQTVENTIERLTLEINNKEYEPLIREILALIDDSQRDYPSKAESLCPAEKLDFMRNEIDTVMSSQGYIGTYPDYFKTGKLNGIHLVAFDGTSRILGFGKNVECHISSRFVYTIDGLAINFICGARFPKKDEPEGDVYSCMFNDDSTVMRSLKLDIHVEEELYELKESVVSAANAAVKAAELKRLTKYEKELVNEGFIF